jgi:hypothetical protein
MKATDKAHQAEGAASADKHWHFADPKELKVNPALAASAAATSASAAALAASAAATSASAASAARSALAPTRSLSGRSRARPEGSIMVRFLKLAVAFFIGIIAAATGGAFFAGIVHLEVYFKIDFFDL